MPDEGAGKACMERRTQPAARGFPPRPSNAAIRAAIGAEKDWVGGGIRAYTAFLILAPSDPRVSRHPLHARGSTADPSTSIRKSGRSACRRPEVR
jgi:hypothetical protein